MARNPCDIDNGRIAGKAAYVYPTVYIGDDQFGDRKRLCNEHCAELLSVLRLKVDNNLQRNCCWNACTSPLGVAATAYAYVTVYDPASQRQDFGGGVCAACLPGLAATMLVDLSQRG